MTLKRLLIVGLGGTTCSGKTTLCHRISKTLTDESNQIACVTINQDEFYFPNDQLIYLPHLNYYNFDEKHAINFVELRKVVKDVKCNLVAEATILIVEGNLIFEDKAFTDESEKRFFLTLPYDRCKEIRSTRIYDPPDVPGYFDQYVWPAYQNHLNYVSSHPELEINILDGRNLDLNYYLIISCLRTWIYGNDWILLCNQILSLTEASEFAKDDSCGSISIFVEYECYEEMAIKQIKEICILLREKFSSIHKVAVLHRLGIVPISEASIIISISSPNRSDSLLAVQYAIDEIKRTVPIWKKEKYVNGVEKWKCNKECSWNYDNVTNSEDTK